MNDNIGQEGVETRFKKGETGNPNGRPKTKPMTDELKACLAQNDGADLKAIISKAIELAKKGDFRYAKEILDRVDGKVIEQLDANVNMNGGINLNAADLALLEKEHGGPGEE